MRSLSTGSNVFPRQPRKTGPGRFFFACVLSLIAGTVMAGEDSVAEIEALISAVENSGCVFERNGDRHDAKG